MDMLRPGSLALEHLTKRFEDGQVTAVDDLSLIINEGEFITILGPSGCGKTTTLRLIAGLERPAAGYIYLGRQLLNHLPPEKRQIAMVFQNYALFPHFSVFRNIAYGLQFQKLPARLIRERVEMVLHLMNLIGLEERAPDQISGGEQQRVALARALILQPKVLLLDEPLSNLDAKLRVQMRAEIQHLQQRLGITTVYVTHDQAEAMSLSNRIAVMHEGRLQQVGTPQEIYQKPASVFVADFIGKANFIESRVEDVSDSILTVGLFDDQIELQRAAHSFQIGDSVFLVIRPEMVHLAADGSGYPGEVRRSTYLGPLVEYEVEAGDQFIFVVDYEPHRGRIYLEGEPVRV
ncbi:MAG: polyamine ABC transporter ATP-binding protein, partial [Chloroflexi bacterium HGW-Chloroflexi-1]